MMTTNGAMADINVTPFIDVMLVLLIVFMIAAPLSTVDVPVNLPTILRRSDASGRKIRSGSALRLI